MNVKFPLLEKLSCLVYLLSVLREYVFCSVDYWSTANIALVLHRMMNELQSSLTSCP